MCNTSVSQPKDKVVLGWAWKDRRDIIQSVNTYHQNNSQEVIGRFIEAHSGSKDSHSQLPKLIELVKEMNGILIVSKRDLLFRKISFISKLMNDNDGNKWPHHYQTHPNSNSTPVDRTEKDFGSQRNKPSLL